MSTQTIRRNRAVNSKVSELRDSLRKRAYLYESPQDFRAGVEAALAAFERVPASGDLDDFLEGI